MKNVADPCLERIPNKYMKTTGSKLPTLDLPKGSTTDDCFNQVKKTFPNVYAADFDGQQCYYLLDTKKDLLAYFKDAGGFDVTACVFLAEGEFLNELGRGPHLL